MEELFTTEAALALVTLTVLEIVLGIDNIIFVSILAGKLPREQQARARSIGLMLAMGTRLVLLASLTWVMRLTSPLFSLFGQEISGRDLILGLGGLFLIWKSVREIHERLEGPEEQHKDSGRAVTFQGVLVQIALLDVVFSLDSVITAIGMANQLAIMVAAVVLAVAFMMFASGPVATFVDRHPTVKMLALSFLMLIGVTLIAESLDQHIPKGYIYFAMAFSVMVEMLNIRAKRVSGGEPVHLRSAYSQE